MVGPARQVHTLAQQHGISACSAPRLPLNHDHFNPAWEGQDGAVYGDCNDKADSLVSLTRTGHGCIKRVLHRSLASGGSSVKKQSAQAHVTCLCVPS